MPVARIDHTTERLAKDVVAIPERFLEGTWGVKGTRICRDAHDCGQGER